MAELSIHGVDTIRITIDRQKSNDCDVANIAFQKNGSKIQEVTVYAENGKQIRIEHEKGIYY